MGGVNAGFLLTSLSYKRRRLFFYKEEDSCLVFESDYNDRKDENLIIDTSLYVDITVTHSSCSQFVVKRCW